MPQADMVGSYLSVLVEWVFLGWLFYRTRLKAVLANLVLCVISFSVTMAWLRLDFLYPARWHTVGRYFDAWHHVSEVLMAASFIWMVLAVVHWGRPGVRLSWRRSPQEG